ncbi:hypothetical protein A7P85_07220 [Eikenella corrodens]|jgi:hypothetical protein|uniref:Uncharacterized protein n=1 Tax=Eikenella corrodens TaxID=539 RepID=A0A1A9RDH5_EIKCO|nr:hypothetical protein [Eikenella corrodens]OAM16196.1 hypothetical protein A7P85_07220 [Eikenella corrodens]OAM23428.1 hypothetical protein A7P92_07555 [Eikenella corrodens]
MKKFSDIITKNEFRFPDFFFFNKELNYNKFLFFDFPLFSDKEFANEFSNILILNNYLELNIFTSVSDSPVVNVDVVNNNLTDIGKIIYEKEINLTGVVITPHNLSWCAAQYYPVDWGVFAFNTHNKKAKSLFDSLDKDWFVTIYQLQKSLNDKSSPLYEEFGKEGIEAILNNYA